MSDGSGPLPYLSYCGVEVANAARTVGYLLRGLGNTTQGHWELTGAALCGVLSRTAAGLPVTYVSPQADPAPWYDASEPGSATFLGLILLDIQGYDGTTQRAVTPRSSGLGGGALGKQNKLPRPWKFRGALVSSDGAGAEYGYRWLSAKLQQNACEVCQGCEIAVRLLCPPANGSDDDQGYWISYDAALTEGVHEVDKYAPRSTSADTDVLAGCRDVVTVEWTMTSANSWLYKPPALRLLVPDTNLNTSFEDDVLHWTPTNAVLTHDTTQAHIGKASARIVTNTTSSERMIEADGVPTYPGQIWSGGAWIKTDDPASVGFAAQVRLRWYQGAIQIAEDIAFVTLSQTWQWASIENRVAPAHTSQVKLAVAYGLGNPSTSRQFLADDAILMRGPNAYDGATLEVQSTCNDIEDFLVGQVGPPILCAALPDVKLGVVGAVVTLHSRNGSGGLLIEAYGDPLPSSNVALPSARERFTRRARGHTRVSRSKVPTATNVFNGYSQLVSPFSQTRPQPTRSFLRGPTFVFVKSPPLLTIHLSEVPAGKTVVVDSARRRITMTDDVSGVTEDASRLLVLDNAAVQWIEKRDCDTNLKHVCVRADHPCSDGATEITIETQAREA